MKNSKYKIGARQMLFSLAAFAFLAHAGTAMAEIPPQCDPGNAWSLTNLPDGWPTEANIPYDYVTPEVAAQLERMLLWKYRGPADLADQTLRCNLTPPLINISADKALEGYQTGSLDGDNQKVLMIDVRTAEEVYWTGTAAQVNKIEFNDGTSVIPDKFIARINPKSSDNQGARLEYTVGGKKMEADVKNVKKTSLSNISYNVPVEFIDSNTGVKTLNPDFGKKVDALIEQVNPSRVIFYCRSGQRSSIGCFYGYCPFAQLFPRVISSFFIAPPPNAIISYEVESEDVNGNGNGGFEGANYSDRFLGHRGFPGRVTNGVTASESVSFKDAGLPLIIGTKPVVPNNTHSPTVPAVTPITPVPWVNR